MVFGFESQKLLSLFGIVFVIINSITIIVVSFSENTFYFCNTPFPTHFWSSHSHLILYVSHMKLNFGGFCIVFFLYFSVYDLSSVCKRQGTSLVPTSLVPTQDS